MRRLRLPLFALLASVFLALASAGAAEVSFVRIWPAWRDADSFDHIKEYFTGQEDTGRETILRTTPATRAGFYFLVRVANPAGDLAGATLVLQLIRPDSPESKTYSFPVTVPAGSHAYELGLTGPDFPNKKFRPVAWQLELQTADHRVVAREASFLWEKPEKK